jgi:hypothetical protein
MTSGPKLTPNVLMIKPQWSTILYPDDGSSCGSGPGAEFWNEGKTRDFGGGGSNPTRTPGPKQADVPETRVKAWEENMMNYRQLTNVWLYFIHPYEFWT